MSTVLSCASLSNSFITRYNDSVLYYSLTFVQTDLLRSCSTELAGFPASDGQISPRFGQGNAGFVDVSTKYDLGYTSNCYKN